MRPAAPITVAGPWGNRTPFPITLDGHPVAVLAPVSERTRWMPRESFLRTIATHQADADLRRELAALAPDTTDDLPL